MLAYLALAFRGGAGVLPRSISGSGSISSILFMELTPLWKVLWVVGFAAGGFVIYYTTVFL